MVGHHAVLDGRDAAAWIVDGNDLAGAGEGLGQINGNWRLIP